ncbi:unnamed protein product [Boreogadus saida]
MCMIRQQGAARSADAADGSGRSAAGGRVLGLRLSGLGLSLRLASPRPAGPRLASPRPAGSAAGESGAGSAAVAVAGESSAGSAAGGSSAGAAGAEAGADPGAVNVAADATGSVPPLPYFEDVDLDSEEQSEPKKQQAPSAAENLSSSQSAGTEAASTSCTGRDPTVITNEGKGVSNSQASCEGEEMEYDSESDTVSSIAIFSGTLSCPSPACQLWVGWGAAACMEARLRMIRSAWQRSPTVFLHQ